MELYREQKPEKKQSLSEQTLSIIIGKFFGFAISIILPIILVRIFSKNDYGTYRQIILIYATFYYLFQLGFSSSIYYFYPKDIKKRAALISNTFFLLLILGFSVLIILVILRDLIVKGFHNPSLRTLLPILGIYLLFMLGSSFFEILLIVEGKGKETGYVYAGTDLLRAVLLITLAVLTKNLYVLILGLSIVSFIRFGFFIFYLNKKYKLSLKRIDLKYFRNQVDYSYPMGLSAISETIGGRLDQYYLSYLTTPSAFAIYSVGNFRIRFLNLAFILIRNVIIPRIVEYQKLGFKQKIISLWHKAIKSLALIGFPSMIFCLIMSKEIITFLYTENYLRSVPVFMIILFMIPAQILSPSTILRAYGATKFIFKANFIALLTSIVLGFLLIKYFYIIGGAFSAVLVFHISVWLQLKKGKELLDVPLAEFYPWKILGKIVIASLLSGILILFVKDIFLHKFVSILMSFLLYFICYIFLINFLKVFVLKEEQLVKKYFLKVKEFIFKMRTRL